ncbi:signal peptidase I [Paenibacillus sp. 598K]|uniref:signal peptidase I n=1 Tax=Paenibacillus sp. 598K TaxID=1117987 RepID=UPI000FF988BB|nr:signal peptidase I [Paenibacillus sp. 598K]GBF77152.1 signal peptidase I [Paenibacillus sp. 598K]
MDGSQMSPEGPAQQAGGRRAKRRQPASRWLRELLEWGKTIAVALIIVLLLHFFVFNLSTVEGQSMEPTLVEKEWLFVNKLVYLTGSPSHEDVVILEDPESPPRATDYLVKRIIGLPGDMIEIRDHQLYRNGELIVERYTDVEIDGPDMAPVVVEAGQYFVMGDNRHARASRDSRSFGTVPERAIKGRADLILWPITRIHKL